MASHRLNGDTTAQSGAPIARYLDDLDGRLFGPRRRRRQILAELRDGLDHATDEHAAAGLSIRDAQMAAVARFGSPQAVADAFSGELATAYARRTIALYIITGPLVGIWWLLSQHPDPWRTGLLALLAAIPVLPLIVIAVAAAGGTLATTGRLMRWLPEATPRRAITATLTIAALCIAGDLTMIGWFLASRTQAGAVAAVAVAASVIRMGCSTVVIRSAAPMARRFETR